MKLQIPRILLIAVPVLLLIVVIIVILAASNQFTPTNQPQYEAAVNFVRAIGTDDNRAALELITPDLRVWAAQVCSFGQIASCLQGLIPAEWGHFVSVVFRQAQPDYNAWNVELIATYEHGLGASGICIYVHTELQGDGSWKVGRWAGWISCGDPRASNMATNPDTPNRAP